MGRLGGGDAGDHLDRDARRAQCFELFLGAREHQRVAALEAHHQAAAAGAVDQGAVDVVLAGALAAGALADADDHRAGGQREHFRLHQRIVDQPVRLGDQARRLQGQQVDASRPGADQHDPCGRLRRARRRQGRRSQAGRASGGGRRRRNSGPRSAADW